MRIQDLGLKFWGLRFRAFVPVGREERRCWILLRAVLVVLLLLKDCG